MDLDFFKAQLSLLNEDNQLIIKQLFKYAPDYFWTIPASSTGKYHPMFSTGEQGLLRHTKAACIILQIYYDNSNIIDHNDFENCLMALLYHDTFKLGYPQTKYTVHNHPLLSAKIFELAKLNNIADLIKTHMGKWNTSCFSKIVLPIPETKLQKLVHFCDFMSSRKWLQDDILDNDKNSKSYIIINNCMKRYNYDIDLLYENEELFTNPEEILND